MPTTYQPPAVTVAQIVRLYLSHCASEGIHCAEAKADRVRTLNLFAQSVGYLTVAEAKPYHLTDFISAHPSWKSVSTRRAKANSIRACFQWAVDQERIGRNPFMRVRYAEAERRPDMSDADFAVLCRLANKSFETAIRFLRLTGCRLSELCRAEWSEIDLDRGVWVIRRHKSRRYTNKPKIVALVPDAVTLLKTVGGNGLIFRNAYGRPWTKNTLVQHLDRLKKRHGILTKATLHGIRHRFGTCAVANGAPIKLVSAQLGHASVVVTERYYVNLEGEIEAIRNAARLGIQ